jgi:hypothetical protein
VRADVELDGDVAHLVLHGASPELASVEYSSATDTYVPWTTRPTNTPLSLPGSETATLAMDSTGRIWIATESGTSVHVYYADSPHTSFSGPEVLATGIGTDDIAAITTLPNSTIGVLWSNQVTERFGFRVHVDSDPPSSWSADEVPASQSALSVGNGMADDHLNVAVASDGTLYAAVKTSYDTVPHPKIALLVRRSNGVWDDLYEVDTVGTRPIVVLNEATAVLHVIYTSSEGLNDIVFRESNTGTISFGSSSTLISGSWNNATSVPQPWSGEVAVLASDSSDASGVLTDFQPCVMGLPGLVGHWRVDEGQGGTAVDSSSHGNDGAINGNPTWVAGQRDLALSIDGDDYVVVPNHCSLMATDALTLAVWIRPTQVDTQRIIRRLDGSSGFSLFLSANEFVSARFNGSNGLRVDSQQDYPTDGAQWMHIAATYDGSDIKLYINGILDAQQSASFTMVDNAASLSLGATTTGANAFDGALDDLRFYNYALTQGEIQQLVSPPVPAMSLWGLFVLASMLAAGGSIMRFHRRAVAS